MSGRQSAATGRALRLVAQGMTPYAAAKKTGIALSTIYRAVKANPRTPAAVREIGAGGVPTPEGDGAV